MHICKRFVTFIIILVFTVVGAAAPGVSHASASQHAQPSLLAMAAAQPDTRLSVIVQKAISDGSVEAAIARLGGVVTMDLNIIAAIAAEVPASAVLPLSQAPSVHWVSLDAPVKQSNASVSQQFTTWATGRELSRGASLDYSDEVNVYNRVIGSARLITEGEYNKGDNDKASIAVVDSGVVNTPDLKGRVKKGINFSKAQHASADLFGHGTFVAGILAGNGKQSDGRYIGVAPYSQLINVRVSDDQGMATESSVVAGLQWIRDNKDKYNIRVVNLSLNSTVAASYNEDPLDIAVEILWFNGIVVVVSGGNSGTANIYPPANDPFVITVGATDDKQTVSTSDDVVAAYSAYGVAESGFVKPDLVAPGTNIVGLLPDTDKAVISQEHPGHRVESTYFRMSGTSMSAPMVSAAVSLLLQNEPTLTPDQVKYRLMATANKAWPGYNAARAGAGYLDIYAAAHTSSTQSANAGIVPTMWLARMAIIAAYNSINGGGNIDWGAVNWNAVNWNAVNWNAVNWNAVNWNAVNWNAVNWNAVNWNAVNWNAVNWNAVNWNAVNWNAVNWNAVNWNAVNWSSDYWGQ